MRVPAGKRRGWWIKNRVGQRRPRHTLRTTSEWAVAAARRSVDGATKARQVGTKQSLIVLFGAGGTERSLEHATASARLGTAMHPEFLSTLTRVLIPFTSICRLAENARFEMPSIEGLIRELRITTRLKETARSDAAWAR